MRAIKVLDVVNALRSGKYTQCQGYLRRGDSYCCLGVAEDLSGVTWIKEDDGCYHDVFGEFCRTSSAARQQMGEWGRFLYSTIDDLIPVQGHLIRLNDSGYPFRAIADWIEKRYEEWSGRCSA